MPETSPAIDLIVPLYNEENVVADFHANLIQTADSLPGRVRILYVNDGSSDHTAERLAEIAARDPRVQVIELSRNFGHQAALSAGLDLSEADYAITLDGDGQHPPEMIPEMLRLAESGYDIVLTQRVEERQPAFFKRVTSQAFYRMLNVVADTRIASGSADFRLLSRGAVQALRKMPEYHRFLRGMVAWMGFKSIILPYAQPERLGGQSKYTARKMLRLALDATFSFSLVPLYIGLSMGAIFLVLAVIEAIYVSSFWILGRESGLAPGWSSLMFMLLVVGGIIMILLGFIGMYVGYIFQEVKRRPPYLIKKIWPDSK